MDKLLADQFVGDLLHSDVDGETMQYIIEEVGMKDQMLRQLIMTSSDESILGLLKEKLGTDEISSIFRS